MGPHFQLGFLSLQAGDLSLNQKAVLSVGGIRANFAAGAEVHYNVPPEGDLRLLFDSLTTLLDTLGEPLPDLEGDIGCGH